MNKFMEIAKKNAEEGINRKELFRYGKYHNTVNMGLFKDELK